MRLWISIIVVPLFIGSILLVNYRAVSSRTYRQAFNIADSSIPVQVVNNTEGAYHTLMEEGVRGRILLVLSSYLHFVEIKDSDVYSQASIYPVRYVNFAEIYEKETNNYHFLWTVMQSNMARKIHHVVPEHVFDLKKDQFENNYEEDVKTTVRVTENHIDIFSKDFPRTISSFIPETEEPLIVIINASYLLHKSESELLEMILASGIQTDILILCMEEDNPTIGSSERLKLKNFELLYRERTRAL